MGDAGPHHTTKGLTAVGVIATILVLFINSVGAFDRAWARKHVSC